MGEASSWAVESSQPLMEDDVMEDNSMFLEMPMGVDLCDLSPEEVEKATLFFASFRNRIGVSTKPEMDFNLSELFSRTPNLDSPVDPFYT
ncbi:hypothetical protein E2562_034047 [Oryza meyeriana var. granulata]|uniref:Uncharacterized protein n=1 Tax=Oryza meyeriana var. granulata TaxID=110450 RepID=A0A6G1CAF1_9ORYZ|nr:hypothetical protein E2562_034047 [Oryza meyeriana var. granulata]